MRNMKHSIWCVGSYLTAAGFGGAIGLAGHDAFAWVGAPAFLVGLALLRFGTRPAHWPPWSNETPDPGAP